MNERGKRDDGEKRKKDMIRKTKRKKKTRGNTTRKRGRGRERDG